MIARQISMAVVRTLLNMLATLFAAVFVVTLFGLDGALPRVFTLLVVALPLFVIAEAAVIVAFRSLKDDGTRRKGRAMAPALVAVAVLGAAPLMVRPIHDPSGRRSSHGQILAALERFHEVI